MGRLLALALLAQMPARPEMAMTRTQLFDHVSLALPDEGPWRVLARTGDGWEEVPSAVLEDSPAKFSLHLRAGSLGVAGAGGKPGHAERRIVARAGGEMREGFLVRGDSAVTHAGRLAGDAYLSRHYALDFIGGSGFYQNFRTEDGLLSRGIGFRIGGRALGIIPFERTDTDFRFTAVRADGGAAFTRRAAEVSVKALVRWSDPKPSAIYLGSNLIEQEVLIDLPRALVLLGNAIDVENWFLLGEDARVLVPGGTRLESPAQLAAGRPYEWIVVATGGGAFVHWLELPGSERALGPLLATGKMKDGNWRVGYRLESIEERWARADPNADGVRMVQWVAVLGGPDFVKQLDLGGAAEKLARALSEPPLRWHVELEPLP